MTENEMDKFIASVRQSYFDNPPIDYVDDYCFDCDVMCKQTDKKHLEHNTLSKQRKMGDIE
ncbi:MAG: hypothetical protein ACW97P_04670 [Candidatus Hodarchaeales archaeon]|jgi:hypothetical protein